MRSTPVLLTRGHGVLILDAVSIDPMPKEIPSRVACLIFFWSYSSSFGEYRPLACNGER